MEDGALGRGGNLKAGPDGKGAIPIVEGVEGTPGGELAEGGSGGGNANGILEAHRWALPPDAILSPQ